MKKYKIHIEVTTDTPEECLKIGNLIQHAVNVVDKNDLIKLLSKVKTNPGIVKTALKFM